VSGQLADPEASRALAFWAASHKSPVQGDFDHLGNFVDVGEVQILEQALGWIVSRSVVLRTWRAGVLRFWDVVRTEERGKERTLWRRWSEGRLISRSTHRFS